ncbi:hypothetical protein EJ110_NYTH27108 [Nymphaea thermarum]|nr:hypothetical protein EJ110_NYTH27108 [Nymphaea thermarum]
MTTHLSYPSTSALSPPKTFWTSTYSWWSPTTCATTSVTQIAVQPSLRSISNPDPISHPSTSPSLLSANLNHLSHNNLKGSLPGKILQYQWITALDLSYNNLVGCLSTDNLLLLTSFTTLDPSCNHFYGNVPTTGFCWHFMSSTLDSCIPAYPLAPATFCLVL